MVLEEYDDAFTFFLCIELWVKLNSGTRKRILVIRNEKLKQSVLQRIQRKSVADSCDSLQ